MNNFSIWFLIGSINALYLGWLIIWKDVFQENKSKRKTGFPEEVKLGFTLAAIGIFFVASVFWPLMVMISIFITWDEYKLADIVLWKHTKH